MIGAMTYDPCPQAMLEVRSPNMITREDKSAYTFQHYRKVGTTLLSNELLPVGTRVATLEGEYVCQEPSRLAVDAAGNVYPVAESVRLMSYELAS